MDTGRNVGGRLLSGAEIRRLRESRETIRLESLHLPVPLLRRLLELLERARPWQVSPRPVPEMTKGEIIRAIRWRVGTIPLAGAQTAAAFVTRHRFRAPRPATPTPPPGKTVDRRRGDRPRGRMR